MVESNFYINNPANNSMKNGDIVLGVMSPPDSLPQYQIYNWSEGQKTFNNLQYDVYQESKSAKPISEKKGFPKIYKWLIGIAAAGVLVLLSLKPINKLIKFFKK